MDRSLKLKVDVRVPPTSKGKLIPAGSTVKESDMPGINIDHLVQVGFAEELPQRFKCPACQADDGATAKAKKQEYDNILDLREHYMTDHPALAAPSTMQEV